MCERLGRGLSVTEKSGSSGCSRAARQLYVRAATAQKTRIIFKRLLQHKTCHILVCAYSHSGWLAGRLRMASTVRACSQCADASAVSNHSAYQRHILLRLLEAQPPTPAVSLQCRSRLMPLNDPNTRTTRLEKRGHSTENRKYIRLVSTKLQNDFFFCDICAHLDLPEWHNAND